MSVSIHSETSKDEIDTEDTELEDLVWSLMSRNGLLPQIRGQIAKFIEDNGKAENVQIYPERADTKILGLIFEYLQWIGMKQTNSVLLSEAPVDIDLSFIKSSTSDSDYRPELCRIFEDHNETEDRGTPTRSHNYSKDEFEDSRLTSASGQHSVRSNDDLENEPGGGDGENLENLSEKKPVSSDSSSEILHDSVKNQEEHIEVQSNQNQGRTIRAKTFTEGFEKGDGSSDLLINFDSPVATPPAPKSFDSHRPNVTVRQRFDIPDPFQSPVGKLVEEQFSKVFDTSNTPSDNDNLQDNRQRLIRASSLFSYSNEKDETPKDLEEPIPFASKGEESLEKFIPGQETDDLSSKNENKDVEAFEQSNPPPPPVQEQQKAAKVTSQDDSESTSDFMETLTMEEDTQDVSIPSEEKGMSSCEHAVSLN